MANFTTRIVLHGADGADYDKLYEEMEAEGFTDIITTVDGSLRKMPDGEYDIKGEFTKEQILDKAKRAAKKTKKEYAAFVTKSSGRVWVNLDKP